MEFFIRKFIKYIFIPFGIIYKLFSTKQKEVIIIMYHRVNDEINKELSVKERNFKWHMNYLKRKKYKVISMYELYNKIINNNIDDNFIVITFDDGYEDYYFNAYPVLKKYNLKSTLYLVPGCVETDNVYWWDKDIGVSKLLNWKQIKELSNNKIIEIGSHTLYHYDLDKINKDLIDKELRVSKSILEKKLNISIDHFSYPRGIYSEEAEKKLKGLYKTAVLVFDGIKINKNLKHTDLYKLKRIPIQKSDGKYLFIARIKGLLILEDLLRKVLNY